MLVCRTQAKHATTCMSALWLVVRNCGCGVWWPSQLGCLWPCLLIGVGGCARLPPAAHGVYLESSELFEGCGAGPSTWMLGAAPSCWTCVPSSKQGLLVSHSDPHACLCYRPLRLPKPSLLRRCQLWHMPV